MRVLIIAIIAFVMSCAFVSCKKDDATKPASQIEGRFTGKYGFGNENPDKGYTLDFKAGGIIEEIGQASGTATGKGTWTLSGNKVTASYAMLSAPHSDYFIVATFDPATGIISGTWAYTNGGADGGKFSVSK